MSYFAGLVFFAGTWGGSMLAGGLVVRRQLPDLRGHARFLAWAVLATAALIASVLLPAVLGVLARGTVLASALLVAGAAWRLPAVAPGRSRQPTEPGGSEDRFDLVIAALGVGGFVIWIALTALRYRSAAPDGFDAVNAYLPTAARWIQTGSVWHIADWVPGSFYGSGPGNGTVVVTSALLPWHDDFVARFAIYPFLLLTAFAVYAFARELCAPRAPSALIGVMVASIPVVAQPGLADALHDPVMYACFAAGLAFGVRHSRTGAGRDLALAALALGLAFGTKFYGYTSVATVLAVWIIARLVARRRALSVAREALVATIVVLFAGGVWMLRDWVVAGNPLLPRKVEVLGITLFGAPRNPLGPLLDPNLATYFDQPDAWTRTLIHQFRIGVGLPLVVLALGLVAASVVLIRRRRERRRFGIDGAAATAAALAAALTVVYTLTPQTAPGPPGMPEAVINIRYGVPALIAAAGVVGWLAGVVGSHWRRALEVVLLAATIDALRVGTTAPPSTAYGAYALAAAIVLVGVVCLRLRWQPRRPRVRAVVALAAVIVVAAGVGAEGLQRTYDAARYRGSDPAIDWVIAHSGRGAAIGLGGSWTLAGLSPTYPLFGPRLENTVSYLGTERRGLLTRYRHGRAFKRAVRRGGFELLFLGRVPHLAVAPGGTLLNATHPRQLRRPAEERWAHQLGYREVVRDPRFIVMRAPASRVAQAVPREARAAGS